MFVCFHVLLGGLLWCGGLLWLMVSAVLTLNMHIFDSTAVFALFVQTSLTLALYRPQHVGGTSEMTDDY